MSEDNPDMFSFLDEIAAQVYEHVKSHGFGGKPLERDQLLIISEVIEMFEDGRKGKATSDHIPEFTCCEEEAADIIIRVLSVSAERGWRIGDAVRAKHAFNLIRPFKHGKLF